MYYDLLVGPIVALYTLIEHSLLWYTSIEQSLILLFRYTAMCVFYVFDIFLTAVAGGQASEEESEEEEESDEEDSGEEEDDDDMEHSGTESDKAVSIPPDVVPATTTTATTEDTSPPDDGISPPDDGTSPDEDASPPDAIASADHVTTGETSADVADTPTVDTQQTKEPGQLLWGCHNSTPLGMLGVYLGFLKGQYVGIVYTMKPYNS